MSIHRRIWWASLPGVPRSLWLLLQVWLWVRWQLFGAWRSCWVAARRLGPSVARDEGLSVVGQLRLIIPLVCGWCIPAPELYRYRIYRQPQRLLEYVYAQETTAFHRYQSQIASRQSLMLLQDKTNQSQLFESLGLAIAPILAMAPRGSRKELRHWVPRDQPVFCKTRHGKGGQGAFAVWWQGEVLKAWTFSGRYLEDHQVETAWRQLLARDDVLIQPRLTTHPMIRELVTGEDVATVRFITLWRQGAPQCLCATLELATGQDAVGGGTSYVILPLDIATGQLRPFPLETLAPAARQHQKQIHERLRGQRIPDWKRIVEDSFEAQRQFADIWAVAWDWAITPEGPRLLEGNAGWSTVTPQLLHGGLLAGSMEMSVDGATRSRP